MDLVNALREECITVRSEAPDKEALLKEIASLAKQCPALEPVSEEIILAALRQREKLGSTGFQNGIAIPHCLLADVDEFVVGLVTHAAGVDFQSLDGNPTFVIPFIIGPKEKRNAHIGLLSAISRVLNDQRVVNELKAAGNPHALAESFLRHVGGTLTQDQSLKRHLVMINIQKEELFDDILQLFSEQDGCYVSVIDAHDSSEYLRGLPLFAAFWSEDTKGFHRIVLVSIRHTLANELLRRLDTLVGGLDNNRGVLVQMLDVLYSSGNIDL